MPRIIAVVTENAPTLSYPIERRYLLNLHRIKNTNSLPGTSIRYRTQVWPIKGSTTALAQQSPFRAMLLSLVYCIYSYISMVLQFIMAFKGIESCTSKDENHEKHFLPSFKAEDLSGSFFISDCKEAG